MAGSYKCTSLPYCGNNYSLKKLCITGPLFERVNVTDENESVPSHFWKKNFRSRLRKENTETKLKWEWKRQTEKGKTRVRSGTERETQLLNKIETERPKTPPSKKLKNKNLICQKIGRVRDDEIIKQTKKKPWLQLTTSSPGVNVVKPFFASSMTLWQK
jgi:hypothetical protein